jgi:hypothetical protein
MIIQSSPTISFKFLRAVFGSQHSRHSGRFDAICAFHELFDPTGA